MNSNCQLNPAGRPSDLTPELLNQIINAVPRVIIQSQVAKLVKTTKQNISLWLKRGEIDQKENKRTIYREFYDEFYAAQARVVEEKLASLGKCPRNYQALTWILEKCFREDFGSESEEIRQLKALFVKILPVLEKGISHGGKEIELDPENAYEEGRIAQGIECSDG